MVLSRTLKRATNKKSGVTVVMDLRAGKSCFLCVVTWFCPFTRVVHSSESHPVTWSGGAISHRVSVPHGPAGHGVLLPAQHVGDTRHDAVGKGSTGYALGGLFSPTCGNLKTFLSSSLFML